MTNEKATSSFRGPRHFLCNFHREALVYKGILYPTAEHAYRQSKAVFESDRHQIAKLKTPGEAKRAGRRIRMLRKDWEEVKVEIMLEIVQVKFKSIALANMLLATEDEELVEENTWGDKFWGTSGGAGKNELGKILMQVREELKEVVT